MVESIALLGDPLFVPDPAPDRVPPRHAGSFAEAVFHAAATAQSATLGGIGPGSLGRGPIDDPCVVVAVDDDVDAAGGEIG